MFSHISRIFMTMKCCHWVVTSCYLFPSPLLSAAWITKTKVHKTKHRSMFLAVQPLAISVVQCWWMVLHCHLQQTRFCWQLEYEVGLRALSNFDPLWRMWVLSCQGDVPVRGEYAQGSLSHEGDKGAGYWAFGPCLLLWHGRCWLLLLGG